MNLCPRCRREFAESEDPTEVGAIVRSRAGDERDGEGTAWFPVAQVTNPAEVGFFADLLEGAGIPTNVHQHNGFSAIDGSWNTEFILRVPREQGKAAAQLLREEVARYGEEEEPTTERSSLQFSYGGLDDPSEVAASNRRGGIWGPVVLILVAGSLAYLAGRNSVLPVRPLPVHDPLRRALSESQIPLTSEDPPGRQGPSRRLVYDPATRSILLHEDLDADGQYERQRRFDAPQ